MPHSRIKIMSDPLTQHGISLEPFRPALFAFPIEEGLFWFVKEEVELLESRYGTPRADAIEIVNRSHGGCPLTSDSMRLHDTPEYWMRSIMEGPRYWENNPPPLLPKAHGAAVGLHPHFRHACLSGLLSAPRPAASNRGR